MSQYKKGTISVDNNSMSVTGHGTKWTSSIAQSNYIFMVKGEVNQYYIDSFINSEQLTLKQPYINQSGLDITRQAYAIVQDYTDYSLFPLVTNKDYNWTGLITKTLRLIDTELYKLGDTFPISALNLEVIQHGTTIQLTSGESFYIPHSSIVAEEGMLICDEYNGLLLYTGEVGSGIPSGGESTIWFPIWKQLRLESGID
jgi:hypothetical protein